MSKERRIYPLDPRTLTEEQMAVAFAMTSRRPEPFDVIAQEVSEEKAATFHERWVLGYGHASVAEHAVLHMAVENVSRLAADTLEDNRLASYTEKSSRFQIIEQGDYYVAPELEGHPLRQVYVDACEALFDAYRRLVEATRGYLASVRPRNEGERDGAYNVRLRREATDSCRFLLPAATLTNIGVTMNARTLEHAITKLLSSTLAEEREIGAELKDQGQSITPTLVKYADHNPYLADTRDALKRRTSSDEWASGAGAVEARLVHFDPEAEEKVVAALMYRFTGQPYEEAWRRAKTMSTEERASLIAEALDRLGPHDAPVRELEFTDYTFDLTMDYGAYREYKRHRMQSYIPQALTVDLGYLVPELVVEAGQQALFEEAMTVSAEAYHQVAQEFPAPAQYLVTHAHYRRVLAKMNLRECYHLFKLRTSPQAHFSIQQVVRQAMDAAVAVHPALFQHLRLRT